MTRWTDCYDVEAAAAAAPAAERAAARDDGERRTIGLRVHVQPGAGRTTVVGRHGDAVKVRVAAPPVDDRANAAVIELVAAVVGVPEASVTLVGGDRSRVKRLRATGVDVEALDELLDAAVREGEGRPRRR